jgi:putative ABC transport system permease protein
MDARVGKGYGPVRESMVTELEHRRIEIVSTYAHGTGFVCDASIVVSDRTLARIFDGYPLNQVSIGLVVLSPGTDAQAVALNLRNRLPIDVQVLTRPELEAREQRFFVRIKPLGVMFSAGVLLSFVVGSVTLYQLLSAEVLNRLREFATLLALGFTLRSMQWIVVQQALIFAACGFVPATALAVGMYAITRLSTHLPMFMTLPRIGLVLLLTLCMCSLAGVLVSWKVGRADPADLF